MSKTAIILFGHGARDPEWARPMQRIAEAVQRMSPQSAVSLAFLEFMTPTLPEAAAGAVAAGADHLVVVPVFLSQGGHVRRDVPRMLAEIQAAHPDLKISLREALGESQQVIDAMASVVLTP